MTARDKEVKASPMDAYTYLQKHYLAAEGRPSIETSDGTVHRFPHLTWQSTSRQWALNGEGVERVELIEEVRFLAPWLGQTTLGSALTRLKREQEELNKEALARRARALTGELGREDDTHLRMWLQAVTGETCDTQMGEANLWAMKQWLWQVLRNAWQVPVTWQVMPVIYSRAQATGKTRLIELLTSPWHDARRTLRSVNLQDQFYMSILGHTLIGVMDEFAGSGDAERLAAFKSLITADTLMARMPHRGDGLELPNRLSLIGSSNLLPPHGVNDEGGSRRIWSIHGSENNIRHDAERKSLAAQVVPDKIYQAVSMDCDCLHDEVPDRVLLFMKQMRQNEWRQVGAVEGWYHYWTVEAPGHSLTLRDARPSLNRYAAEHGHPRPKGAYDVIAAQLEALGAEVPSTGREYPIRNRRLAEGEGAGMPKHLKLVREGEKRT